MKHGFFEYAFSVEDAEAEVIGAGGQKFTVSL
jgi:hypothetical protein